MWRELGGRRRASSLNSSGRWVPTLTLARPSQRDVRGPCSLQAAGKVGAAGAALAWPFVPCPALVLVSLSGFENLTLESF